MAGVVPPPRLCARIRCSPPAPLRCRLPSLLVATVPPGLRSEEQPREPEASVPPGLTSDRALWHARVCSPLRNTIGYTALARACSRGVAGAAGAGGAA